VVIDAYVDNKCTNISVSLIRDVVDDDVVVWVCVFFFLYGWRIMWMVM